MLMPSEVLALTQDIRSAAAKQRKVGACESSQGTWLPELNVDGITVKRAKSNFIFKFLSYLDLKQHTLYRLPY